MKLAVIIPMAGSGQRFKDAGYNDYKPFIRVKDRFMIDLAIEPYPREVKKFFIVNPDYLTSEQIAYLGSIENSEIIKISGHKNGPSYSIHLAKDRLPKEYSYFISYVDIYWTWDFDEVKKSLDYPGMIFTRTGWHPHLFGNNFSAFCLPKKDDSILLEKIKEKSSFTDDHMKEPLSIGAFYFKDSKDLFGSIDSQIRDDRRVAGEYYPSEIFNSLIESGKEVRMQEVDFFIHFGLPSQLEDFNYWKYIFSRRHKSTKKKVVCIMGGLGKRMKEVSASPKALIDIEGYPMFEYVLKEFGSSDNLVVTTDEVASRLPKKKIDYSLIDIGKQTDSQMQTIAGSVSELRKYDDFFMISCDAFGIIDGMALDGFISRVHPDALIFTFTPTLLQQKMSGQHTHVTVKEDRITGVHIKLRSGEDDRGLAGFFYFRSGKLFDGLGDVPKDPKNELIADHFLKHLVEIGKKVYAYPLESYIHIGTVPEYKEYIFWSRYSKVLLD